PPPPPFPPPPPPRHLPPHKPPCPTRRPADRAAAAAAGRTPPVAPETMARIMAGYEQAKRRQRVVDFDDLLVLAIRDLRSDPAYAEAIRWRYRHLYVDEFQDVNPLQAELLSLWRGGRNDLFVVGDPNQAIYGWNGADPDLLNHFTAHEPDATVIELRQNYRSTPQVLALASTLARSGPLEPQRGDGPNPTVTAYANDVAEAAGVARRIRDAHSVAGSWSDQAVLVRTNAQLLLLSEELRRASIPIRLRGAEGPLATAEVRAERERLEQEGPGLAAAVSELSYRLSDEPDQPSVAEIERRANISAFVRLVNDYLALDPHPTGAGLKEWLATLEPGDLDDGEDAVELTTFHGAKGLEWPVVHVAGLEEGYVPIVYATTGGQLAEEQRLLYVALTRAEDELHLSWAAERTFGTRTSTRNPSPHLAMLADAGRRLAVGPAQRVDWRRHLAESRSRLQAADTAVGRTPRPDRPPAEHVHDALRQWRQRRARAADVPPHAVFSDQTLRAIAKARPSTKAGLATIPGIGPTKLERFGSDLLAVVAEATVREDAQSGR
ncbi:MAG: ATP-dependent DNA helicase UvrD2, partial [Actinomycetota bacterium]